MKPVLYTKYPLPSVLIYNGVTFLHFLLGGAGIMLGYLSWTGYSLGIAYLLFAFTEMYLLMPIRVCPNCPYYKLGNSICISGLNLVSRKLAKEGNVGDFSRRAGGMLCPNNLYIAGLVLPILLIIPALVINFSWVALGIMLIIIGLLVFRFFIIFPKIACGHCQAIDICPNARSMKLNST
jgi:hypothetical protein